jgi:hypothetical protein
MTFLTRIDPTRNVDRFYVVQVMPSLFGDWTVLRECGAGAAPRATCGSAATSDAMKPRAAEHRTVKRRLQRGYAAI